MITKEEIKKIKEENGNQSFTTKELVWYLVSKLDKLNEKLDKKVDKSFFYWFMGVVITITSSILFLLFKLILS